MNPSMLSVPKSRVAVSWVDIPVKGTQVVLRGRLHDTYPTDPIDVVVPKTVALVLHPHPRYVGQVFTRPVVNDLASCLFHRVPPISLSARARSRLGGDAENNVTVALTRAISRTELIPCLRFDSRGVGESSGRFELASAWVRILSEILTCVLSSSWYPPLPLSPLACAGSATWFGSSEPDDIIAVLDFLTDPAGRVRAERVFVVGYSFGSSVLGTALSYIYALDLAASSQGATTAGASAAAAGASSPLLPASTVALLDAALAGRLARAIVGAIFVSYPCGFFARFLLGGHVSSLRTLVAAAPSLPLLFVTAEGDELTSASAVQVMVRRLNSPNAVRTPPQRNPPPLSPRHFFPMLIPLSLPLFPPLRPARPADGDHARGRLAHVVQRRAAARQRRSRVHPAPAGRREAAPPGQRQRRRGRRGRFLTEYHRRRGILRERPWLSTGATPPRLPGPGYEGHEHGLAGLPPAPLRPAERLPLLPLRTPQGPCRRVSVTCWHGSIHRRVSDWIVYSGNSVTTAWE